MKLYILRVYTDDGVFEYEYGLIEHAQAHMREERNMCMLTEYAGNGVEHLIECKAERG